MMKYIVAVSGGVDSVVLLDMLAKAGKHELVVAHFDHGIRLDSADDARFVEALAHKYDVPFFSRREELGPNASEELARRQRYKFLRGLAKKHKAKIVTAHHADDVVETITINILRGTGWRGLAVLGAADIARPLDRLTKRDIYMYALKNRLEWVEDSTNTSEAYLRNRIRARLARISDEMKKKLWQLWLTQAALKPRVEMEAKRIVENQPCLSRHIIIMVPVNVAVELLRYVIWRETGKSLLYEQAERGVLAIKTARAGTTVQVGEGVEIRLGKSGFHIL